MPFSGNEELERLRHVVCEADRIGVIVPDVARQPRRIAVLGEASLQERAESEVELRVEVRREDVARHDVGEGPGADLPSPLIEDARKEAAATHVTSGCGNPSPLYGARQGHDEQALR